MGKLVDELTDKRIKAAQAQAALCKLSDGNGLYLMVATSGSKWWRFDYRFGGKQQSISFGIYGTRDDQISLSKARDLAEAARADIKKGVNPADPRKALKAASVKDETRTFRQVADEWLKTRAGGGKKTYARDARMVGYLKDGKGTAKGFDRVDVEDVELRHLSPLLKVVNHPTRVRFVSAARNIVAFAKVHGD
jgi:Arm DNA-binding domain